MRVHLKTLGCRLNEAELETWSRAFGQRGHEITTQARDADLVVINTCAVTAESVKKSRNLVRRARRDSPASHIVVTGCYAALSPEAAAHELNADLVIDNQDKDQLVETVIDRLQITDADPGGYETTLLQQGRQRAFIKVQDGCRYRCTYCIVTVARGKERSRSIHDVITEVNRLHAEGVHEVALAGVHLGGYGSDLGTSLKDLLQAVLAQTQMPRIRLGSLEPWDLPDDFWTLFANRRLMPHLHLPIQSGSDSVLRRMSRRCRTGEFRELIQSARRQVADFNVTTDVIVGFPGETDDEWQQTLDFTRSIGFGHIHIFSYSAREGTKAARLPDQLDRTVKRERSQQLHDVAARSRAACLQDQIGREFTVLIEGTTTIGPDSQALWSGYTPHYLRVSLPLPDAGSWENRLMRVRIERVDEGGEQLVGRMIDDITPSRPDPARNTAQISISTQIGQ